MKNAITRSKINRAFKRSSPGDTIVEVMISMSVLAIVLVATYSFSNRAFQSGLNSQYRDQAVSYAQQQLELLREADNNIPQNIDDYLKAPYNTPFCINPSTKARQPAASCTFNNLYNVTYTYDGSNSGSKIVKVVASWDSASAVKQQTVVYYKPNNSFTGTFTACNDSSDPATCAPVLTSVPAVGVSTDAPDPVNVNTPFHISWASTNISPGSCRAEGPGGFTKNPIPDNGTSSSVALSSAGSYDFKVTCNNNAGSPVSGLVTVHVTTPFASVTTGSASLVTYNSAALNGKVNPLGFSITSCNFWYDINPYSAGTSLPGHGTPTTSCSPSPGGGNSDVDVSAPANLSATTTYHFQICAQNAYNTSCGDDSTFTTGVAPPASYPPSSYPPSSYPPSSYPPSSYPPASYPPSSYPPASYPPAAYCANGALNPPKCNAF
jgi:Tfp pilus assembly protein PilV